MGEGFSRHVAGMVFHSAGWLSYSCQSFLSALVPGSADQIRLFVPHTDTHTHTHTNFSDLNRQGRVVGGRFFSPPKKSTNQNWQKFTIIFSLFFLFTGTKNRRRGGRVSRPNNPISAGIEGEARREEERRRANPEHM